MKNFYVTRGDVEYKNEMDLREEYCLDPAEFFADEDFNEGMKVESNLEFARMESGNTKLKVVFGVDLIEYEKDETKVTKDYEIEVPTNLLELADQTTLLEVATATVSFMSIYGPTDITDIGYVKNLLLETSVKGDELVLRIVVKIQDAEVVSIPLDSYTGVLKRVEKTSNIKDISLVPYEEKKDVLRVLVTGVEEAEYDRYLEHMGDYKKFSYHPHLLQYASYEAQEGFWSQQTLGLTELIGYDAETKEVEFLLHYNDIDLVICGLMKDGKLDINLEDYRFEEMLNGGSTFNVGIINLKGRNYE